VNMFEFGVWLNPARYLLCTLRLWLRAQPYVAVFVEVGVVLLVGGGGHKEGVGRDRVNGAMSPFIP
jgi:hypothetical protein